ncbi:MAG TPA: hypothetical protein VNH53_03230 [Sphingomicrobium sp.]|jgi:hypothetical protein|nr:hypothetical protein [Sphingomicrobium sp.]
MTDSRTLDADRLPWLTDGESLQERSVGSPLVTWGVTALLLVAGVSYWAGRTSDVDVPPAPASIDTSRDTARLPEPRPLPADTAQQPPQITPVPVPKVELSKPTPAPAIAEPSVAKRQVDPARSKARAANRAAVRKSARKPASRRIPAGTPVTAQAEEQTVPMAAQAWPRPAEAVPLRRVIHIGTYSTPEKNHDAWQSALRRYPQMRGLPKITGVYRAANGRIYYPLYIMTAGHDQSEWLCRRLRRDWRSCTIISA